MTAMTIPQLEEAILADVVTDFVEAKKSTARRPLLIKFLNQPAAEAISNLVNQNIIRRKDTHVATVDEEYLPAAAAFQFCGKPEFREQAKLATTIVLQALQRMFVPERRTEGFVFEDLKKQVAKDNRIVEDATLKLGIYLVRDLGKLASSQLVDPDQTELKTFQVGEAVTNMPDPASEWDQAMAGFRRRVGVADDDEEAEEVLWEEITRLGGGGQSEVFLARCPARVSERAKLLRTIRKTLYGDKEAELANAIAAYARPELPSEHGAMKKFKIRDEGGEQQALQRLQQEIAVLKENRPGLPRLLDSSESERWIVTEYFPRKTLEDNIEVYKGKPALALKAFLSLVDTVALLHEDNIVHRDIKPANVFIRKDEELVLGDFGIVYVPNQPKRLTRTNESVGPHDYMPPWAAGERLDDVHTKFDVYMLGKLLWCMVSGHLFLNREFFREPDTDLTKLFPHDPHVHMIDAIPEKCLVDRPENCASISLVHSMVIAFVQVIEQGGQLLNGKDVPKPCHVCGIGEYKPDLLELSDPSKNLFGLRMWHGNGADSSRMRVGIFTCDRCGHVQLFKSLR